MDISVGEIAKLVGGTVVGDAATRVTGLSSIEAAKPGDLTFAKDARYLGHLPTTRAAAAFVPNGDVPAGAPTLIQVTSPYGAFVTLLLRREAELSRRPQGIHPTAAIADTARIGRNVSIDAWCTIEDNVTIGDNTVVYAGAYVGHGVQLGRDVVVYPRAVIRERVTIGARCVIHSGAVIGSDGFGFEVFNG